MNIIEEFNNTVNEIFNNEVMIDSTAKDDPSLFNTPSDSATCDKGDKHEKMLERIGTPIQSLGSILVMVEGRRAKDLFLIERRFSEKSKRVPAGDLCVSYVKYVCTKKTTPHSLGSMFSSLAANCGFRAVNFHHLATTRKRLQDLISEAYCDVSPFAVYLNREELRVVDDISDCDCTKFINKMMAK